MTMLHPWLKGQDRSGDRRRATSAVCPSTSHGMKSSSSRRLSESVIVQAPAPARVMDGGMVTTAFAAHIAVSKFAWHLPLHRQAQMLASCGVIIDRGTLGAWVTRVAWWLELLYDALTAFIRS